MYECAVCTDFGMVSLNDVRSKLSKMDATRKYPNLILLFANYCWYRSQEKFISSFCLENWFSSVCLRRQCSMVQSIDSVEMCLSGWHTMAWHSTVDQKCIAWSFQNMLQQFLIPFPRNAGNMSGSVYWSSFGFGVSNLIVWFGLFQYAFLLIKNNLMKIRVTRIRTQKQLESLKLRPNYI